MPETKYKFYPGQIIQKTIVIKDEKININGRMVRNIKCKCLKCGKIFHKRPRRLMNGKAFGCKECVKDFIYEQGRGQNYSDGKRVGKYTILKKVKIKKIINKKEVYKNFLRCQCDCGNIRDIRLEELKLGRTKACKSCSHRKTHKQSSTKIYSKWRSMIDRCYNNKQKTYHRYGGRGITVCKDWKESFECFIKDMGYPPTEKHQIDRIDNNGNYCKDNCKWSTKKENCRNRNNTRKISMDGKTKPLIEWCEQYKINYGTVISRLDQSKWSAEEAIKTPSGAKRIIPDSKPSPQSDETEQDPQP